MFEQAQSVAVGQHYVEQDAVVAVSGYLVVGVGVVGGAFHYVAFVEQAAGYNLAQGVVIFYNQYLHSLNGLCKYSPRF